MKKHRKFCELPLKAMKAGEGTKNKFAFTSVTRWQGVSAPIENNEYSISISVHTIKYIIK